MERTEPGPTWWHRALSGAGWVVGSSPHCDTNGSMKLWRQSRRKMALVVSLAFPTVLAACNAPLPEADSPGAQLYAARCSSGCHRLFAPRSLTSEMWKVQVDRMQDDIARQGLPPLTLQERELVLDYLKRHSQ